SGNNYGRATSVAALALKARMLLYAASPLMNKAGVDPLVGYPSPDPARWQKVADADKAVIDLATQNGYKLYDASPGDIKQRYTDMFLDKQNPEVLFSRQNYGNTNNSEYIDQANGPNGYDQWGGNTPTQEFVDAFDMADGSKFSWSNPAMAAHPYANRDPRLSAFVLVDGDLWKGRPVETHFNEVTAGVFRGGLDTKDGGSPWNTSKTGYNMRKFLNPEYVTNSWVFTGKSAQNWVWLRLAEFYLDYSEAQYNLANEAEAKSATYGINKIRARAGMPVVTESGTALWDRIVNERRIELSFEEHRFFDIRRWMIADVVMNQPATGVIVKKYLNGTFEYKAHAGTETLTEDRKFVASKMYWLPIPQGERDKNPNLKQNPGY
ncbi:MAG: RagB/SusD family nutrient uptake outer membrane protein, partial [Ferruginibacter sp.]